MSLPFGLGGMSGTKKEKHYANSRARRGSIVVSQAGSKKSKKYTDTESVSSEASTVVPPPPPKPQCPLRPYMEIMFEPEEEDGEKKRRVCPLRKVKLSHVLPLCLFVMINMFLVIGTLLITGVCRVTGTLLDWGRKQPNKDMNNATYDQIIHSPEVNGLTFLAMAMFAFFVTLCYGPEWMSTIFQICTTTGFFVGISMTLMTKKGASKAVELSPESPTSPVTVGS